MKSIKGITLIVASLALTIFAWLSSGISNFLIPGLALTTLSWTFLLTTRSAHLEVLFHGIENMYAIHKVMAVFSLILLAFHNISMGGLWGSHLAAQLGNIGIDLFVSIVLVAFLGKILKYETWRWIHRLVYLAYIFGLLHVYMMIGARLTQPSLLSFVVGFFAILGLAAGFYIIFLYQTIAFPYLGKIIGLKHLNHDTTEIEIQLSQAFTYEYGQFAFLKIHQDGFEKAPHPFSISGGSGNRIFFTIKASGDHTQQIYNELQLGSRVSIDRAYGHMLLKEGRKQQVWIAGGIGITPFISYLREKKDLQQKVSFYYAYSGEENAVYLDFLREYAEQNSNLDLHIVNSQKEGYLDFSNYPLTDHTTIFMCGPTKMMEAFTQTFTKINPKAELIYEGFSFK